MPNIGIKVSPTKVMASKTVPSPPNEIKQSILLCKSDQKPQKQ